MEIDIFYQISNIFNLLKLKATKNITKYQKQMKFVA